MNLKKWLATLGVTGWLTLGLATAVAAQAPTSCGELVQQALRAAGEICANITRNQVCYGNLSGSITPRNLSSDLIWEAAGDTVNLGDIAGLTLSPLIEENQQWGVAVMQVQASLPDTLPGQNVLILLFGDVVVDDTSAANPMQAFYFKTGMGATECSEAPANGIMIQTPTGVGLVELTINGVKVALGSTALLTFPSAEEGRALRVTLLDGEGYVEANGVQRMIVTGGVRDIELDEDGNPTGEISELYPYDPYEFWYFADMLYENGVELYELDDDYLAYLDELDEMDWDDYETYWEGWEDSEDVADEGDESEDISDEFDESDDGGDEDTDTDDGGGGGDDGGGGDGGGDGGGGDDGGGGGEE